MPAVIKPGLLTACAGVEPGTAEYRALEEAVHAALARYPLEKAWLDGDPRAQLRAVRRLRDQIRRFIKNEDQGTILAAEGLIPDDDIAQPAYSLKVLAEHLDKQVLQLAKRASSRPRRGGRQTTESRMMLLDRLARAFQTYNAVEPLAYEVYLWKFLRIMCWAKRVKLPKRDSDRRPLLSRDLLRPQRTIPPVARRK